MNPEQRAAHGQALLDNPVFLELMGHINESINREMDKVKPNDMETMKHLITSRQVANKISAYIISEASNRDNEFKAYNANPKKKILSFK